MYRVCTGYSVQYTPAILMCRPYEATATDRKIKQNCTIGNRKLGCCIQSKYGPNVNFYEMITTFANATPRLVMTQLKSNKFFIHPLIMMENSSHGPLKPITVFYLVLPEHGAQLRIEKSNFMTAGKEKTTTTTQMILFAHELKLWKTQQGVRVAHCKLKSLVFL